MTSPARWRARVALLSVLAAVAPGVAHAEDPPTPPAGPATKPATPLSPGDAADAVLRAWNGKDGAALAAVAAGSEPDPWLVADELVRREQFDAAEAFAGAAPRKAVERLPAYVASRRGQPDDAGRRTRLAASLAAETKPAEALEALGAPEAGPLDDVVGVRLTFARGAALRLLRRSAEAAPALLAAAEAADRLGWFARATQAFNDAGEAAFLASGFADALRAWERRLALCEAIGDDRGVATTLVAIGNVHWTLGDHRKALALYERALAAHEGRGDLQSVAVTLTNIGNVYSALGEYAKAKASQERALATYERAAEQGARGQEAKVATSLTNLGGVHVAVGEFAKGLALFERALAVHEAQGDRLGASRDLAAIGTVHAALGDLAKALETQTRALGEAEALGDRIGTARMLNNIACIHAQLGDFEKALALTERAQAMREAVGDKVGAAQLLGNLGAYYVRLGDLESAMETLTRALAVEEALGNKARIARTLVGVGTVHVHRGEHAEALALYERALAAMEAAGDQAGAADVLNNLGTAHLALGDSKAAREVLSRGVRLARSLRYARALVLNLSNLARAYLAGGANGRALGTAREALRESEVLLGGLAEEEGAQARTTQSAIYEVGAAAASREEDAAEVCAFLESGRAGALLDAMDKREALRWKAETLPDDLRAADEHAAATERAARSAYDRALQGDDRKARTLASRALDEAIENVRDVNARIQRETKRAAGLFYPRARTIDQIRAALEPGEALVLYGLCMQEALALVVEPAGERLVPLGGRQAVEEACEALALREPGGDPTVVRSTLEGLLVKPLALGEGVKRVLVSPDGALCFLPWGALFDRAVAVTPSGSTHALLREEEREPGVGVLALGDPDYAGAAPGAQATYHRGRTLVPLPGTRAEAEAVGTVTLLGPQASEDGLKAALRGRKHWRAVHLACHGLIDASRPGLSSLALSRSGASDGFLTALEVLRMEVPADLAVLSACETATGKLEGGEGIVGLTRAFMYAGTPRVLCSLWKVDDEATAALMKKFYELWNPKDGTPGLPAAEALRRAQQFVAAQKRWSHPYYWAAWVLWGLPS